MRKGKPFYEAKAGTLDIREIEYVKRENVKREREA